MEQLVSVVIVKALKFYTVCSARTGVARILCWGGLRTEAP